jgi:hypothetical protein
MSARKRELGSAHKKEPRDRRGLKQALTRKDVGLPQLPKDQPIEDGVAQARPERDRKPRPEERRVGPSWNVFQGGV